MNRFPKASLWRLQGGALAFLAFASPALAQSMPADQAAAIVEPRLPAVLQETPSNQPVPWNDEASGLSGSIVVYTPRLDGTRPCRALRYTVDGATTRFAVEGERCREPDGEWVAGRVPDRTFEAAAASPLIRDLQAALRRLAYYAGPVDGVASDPLGRAALAFEHDEQVPPDAEPSPGLLELADAAIGRIPEAGSCTPEQPVPEGWSAACGSVR